MKRACFLTAVLGAASFCGGCAHAMPQARISPGTSRSPADFWKPPAGQPAPPAAKLEPEIPREINQPGRKWTLADLVDVALRNSSETREAWLAARASAAALGSEKGTLYPSIFSDIDASVRKSAFTSGGGSFGSSSSAAASGTAVPPPADPSTLSTLQPAANGGGSGGGGGGGVSVIRRSSATGSLELDYILFDFGRRRADIEQARQALIAANWNHNAAIQRVVLRVHEAFYNAVYALALVEAQEASLKEAQTSLDAATGRHDAGLATIADVLQARTALSQAQLALQTTQGQIETLRGALATAAGLPANLPFQVELPPEELPVDQVMEEVDGLIGRAISLRPDLAAARAQALQAQAQIRRQEADSRPSVTATGTAGGIYFRGEPGVESVYSASVLLRIPIFNGFSRKYDVLRAKAEAEAAQARLVGFEKDVTLQVWTSYYNLRTARQRVKTSKDLFDSARQSHDVALERYKAGVSSVLDLLTAQSQLENARAVQAGARTEWFLAVAQLARDTGTLWLSESQVTGAASPAGD